MKSSKDEDKDDDKKSSKDDDVEDDEIKVGDKMKIVIVDDKIMVMEEDLFLVCIFIMELFVIVLELIGLLFLFLVVFDGNIVFEFKSMDEDDLCFNFIENFFGSFEF